jgi:hypothetical protein
MEGSGRAALFVEATATGFFLGLVQVALGFALLAGADASALRFFALTAAWLAGSALGVLRGGRGDASSTRLLAVALVAIAVARAALARAPFHDAAAVLGLFAGALAGGYAGRFLGERAATWGDVRALLVHENNGFIAGFAAGSLLLCVSARALDAAVGALGAFLLGSRALGRPSGAGNAIREVRRADAGGDP